MEAQLELLERQKRAENELRARIADLKTQLETKAAISGERDTEISDFRKNQESRAQTLEPRLQEKMLGISF